MPKQLVALNEQREAEHAQNVAQALQLRADGMSLADIAKKLSISVSSARTYWREGLAMVLADAKEDAEEVRRALIDQATERISKWSVLANLPHVEGADRAAAIVIRDSEHLARLHGLDKIDPNAKPPADAVDVTEALKSKAAREALRRMLDEADRAAGQKPALPA